jgi:uncharacterized glyoxalase superfamily protein PhnB
MKYVARITVSAHLLGHSLATGGDGLYLYAPDVDAAFARATAAGAKITMPLTDMFRGIVLRRWRTRPGPGGIGR